MIIRTLKEITNSEKNVEWGNGLSRRFLVKKDNMGFSLTDTTVLAGKTSHLEYKNHLEACYCIEGEGEVVVNDARYKIVPGTMYALDKHEPHLLIANTDMRLICVFNPPLNGEENHKLQNNNSSSY